MSVKKTQAGNSKNLKAIETMLGLPQDHSLELTSSHTNRLNGTKHEVCWLYEYDARQQRIARVRTWNNRSSSPPYRTQQGWERFSLSGALLDREVRYSKRDDMSYLH